MSETLWPELDLAERYESAQSFFDAGDYQTARRLLVDVVHANRPIKRPGCCSPVPTTTRPRYAEPRSNFA